MEQERKERITRYEESLILEQIKYLHGEANTVQDSFLKFMSIPLAIYAVAIIYAFECSASEFIFLLLPFFFSMTLFNLLKYTKKYWVWMPI